jgi:hypothetical protein
MGTQFSLYGLSHKNCALEMCYSPNNFQVKITSCYQQNILVVLKYQTNLFDGLQMLL